MKKLFVLALLAIAFFLPGKVDAQNFKAVASQQANISLDQFSDYDLTSSHNDRRSCDKRDRDYRDRRYRDNNRCGKKRGKGHYKGRGKGHQKHGCNCCCGRNRDYDDDDDDDDDYYDDDDCDDDDDYYDDDDDDDYYGRDNRQRRERDVRGIIGKRDDRKYEPTNRRSSETKTERRERELKDILGKRISNILIPQD